jgi:hypothetical protein
MTRIEQSPAGRAVLSVLIVLFLLAITTANVPVSGFHDKVKKVDDPLLSALGARQFWSVFAPDPQQVVSTLSVRFTYRDGTTSVWRIRKRNPFTGAYRDYRWLKLAENAPRSQAAGTGLLLWAARNRALAKPLAKAELVRSVYDIAPPGKPASDHSPPESGVLYALEAGG